MGCEQGSEARHRDARRRLWSSRQDSGTGPQAVAVGLERRG